jgi:hypothetical protein
VPQVLALLPLILPAALAGVGTGVGIYEGLNKPKPPDQAALVNALKQANQFNPTQLANAVRASKGDVQAQTSGGVSPDYLTQLIQSQYGSAAGNPGVVGQQTAQQWGGSFGTTGSSSGSGGSSFGSSTGSIPFGNASSGGLGGTGLASSGGSSGFNISDWLQQLQQGGANA